MAERGTWRSVSKRAGTRACDVRCSCGQNEWCISSKDLFPAFNKMQQNEKRRRRYHLQKQASGSHTEEEFAAVVASQQERCFYCNTSFSKLQKSRDHVLPLKHGGSHYISNIVAACRSCNTRRGNTPFLTYAFAKRPRYCAMIGHLLRRLEWVKCADLPACRLAEFYIAFTLISSRTRTTVPRRKPGKTASLSTTFDKFKQECSAQSAESFVWSGIYCC